MDRVSAGRSSSADPAQVLGESRPARTAARRYWEALGWALGIAVLFVLLLRIAYTETVASDAANNALQAWDLLHGNLDLHGWILADVTFYTFELPLIAVLETVFGLGLTAVHVALALIYLIVAVCAVAVAVTDSRGASRLARAAVVVAVLAAPILNSSDKWIPIGLPDHTGTTAFLLLSALLVDRAPARRFTAPLLCVLLCAGQLGDTTVRYVAVPAIVVMCGYRIIAARSFRTGDTANLLAAAVSVPLSLAIRAAMRHAGAYVAIAPKTQLSPVSQWGHHAALTWGSLRLLFGQVAAPGYPHAGAAAIFGAICMLVAAAGALRVLYRWRTASRAEQALVIAIAANIGVYILSKMAGPSTPHDLVTVLPSGAVLGARALVPRQIAGRARTTVVTGALLAAALVPLAVTAALPAHEETRAPLAAWLQAHGLHDGLSGYWDASIVSLLTGDNVHISAVQVQDGKITRRPWDSDSAWYDPATNDANFVVIDNGLPLRKALQVFGKPAAEYRAGKWQVLTYHHNLLTRLQPARVPPTD